MGMQEPGQDTRRIVREHAGLLMVDIQERLLPAVVDPEGTLDNAVRLVQGAAILGLPVIATEQYPKGLGPTVRAVAQAASGTRFVEKLTFSAWDASGLPEIVRELGLRDLVLFGLEAHVCVAQTCLDVLDEGLRAFVVADAVSSRSAENRRLGLERMRDAGAIVVSTEMILFELLERAGTESFKQIQRLVK